MKIEDRMSQVLFTVRPGDSLAAAREKMTANSCRHLPVVEDGALVGLISLGDLYVMEALNELDPEDTEVQSAMCKDILAVPQGTPLRQVAADMARLHVGSAIVVDGVRPIGIFTSTDACRVLAEVLPPVGA